MAKGPTLLALTNLANVISALSLINGNTEALEEAFQNTVSRDGSSPNQMEADFDMNGNTILNVADPVADTDGVNLRSIRPIVDAYASQIVETAVLGSQHADKYTATAGQDSFLLSYEPGSLQNVSVFVDGLALLPTTDYSVSGPTLQTVTLTTPLAGGEDVLIRYSNVLPSGSTDASAVLYTAPGGAGPTVKDFLDDLSGPNGGLNIGFVQEGVGATTRTVQEKLREQVHVKDFGAVGDGIADDTAAFAAAITYLNSIGWAKSLSLSSYKLKVTSPLPLITAAQSPTIVGDGAQVIVSHATGDCITFYSGGGGPQILNPRVDGIEFTAGVTRTAGSAVRGLNVNDMRVSNCTFRNQYNAIKIGVFQYGVIDGCTFLECVQGVEQAQGSGGTVSNCRMQTGSGTTPTPGTVGLLLTNSSGLMVTNTDIVRIDTGILGQPVAGAVVQFLFLVNTLLDTCNTGMLLTNSNGGEVSSIYASNCWFSSCHNNGVYAASVKNMRLDGCEMIVNHKEAVNLITCEQVRIRGGLIGWNNTDNAATGSGVVATGVAGLTLEDVLFTNRAGWVSYGATQNQKYAVQLTGTASSDITIRNCTMVDHVTGDVRVDTAPTGVSQVSGNRTTRSSTVASATNIAVEPMHEFVSITGTTTVQNIGLPLFTNQQLRLRTVDGCQISDGFNFKLAGNFVGTANSILSLIGVPGFGWVETSRAII